MAKFHFRLKNKLTNEEYGDMYFNGKFIFCLDEKIDLDLWNRIGLIPVDDNREQESLDLFFYINSRLPIELRGASKSKKIDYIKENGLEVASDNFIFSFKS
ncbi:MAG TPA: hypothetical protein VK694_07010 [Verrucomicrobiae bacterium]|nr:hypothetical protein [Verrucomicrobiae bacterium]